MKKGYLAYNLTEKGRAELLERFSPVFSKVVAHHVTFEMGVGEDSPLPPKAEIKVVGYARNEKIECVVVEVGGTVHRNDGSIYHITLSHSDEARPVQSNDLLKEQGYELVEQFSVETEPTFNSF